MNLEPIWRIDDVRDHLDHDHERVRLWALRWLDAHADPDVAAEAGVDALDDPNPKTAGFALELASARDPNDYADRLRDLLDRNDIDEGTRQVARPLLAAAGDADARTSLFEAPADEPIEWSLWAEHDPDGFAEALADEFGRAALPPDLELLDGAIETADPDLLEGIFGAVEGLQEDQTEYVIHRLLNRGGGALPGFPDPANIEWQPAGEADAFALEDARMDDHVEALRDALEDRHFDTFVDRTETLFEEVVEAPPAPREAPTLEWLVAFGRRATDYLDAVGDDRLRVQAAWGATVGLVQTWRAEAALAGNPEFAQLLELAEETLGAEGQRVDEALRDAWEAGLREGNPAEDHVEALSDWLDTPDDIMAMMDRLQLVRGLEGAPVEGILDDLLDHVVADADSIRNQETAQALLAVVGDLLGESPNLLERRLDELLNGPQLAASASLIGLGRANQKWASEAWADHLDQLLASHPSSDVWDHTELLGDPDLLETVLEEWYPTEHEATRCAHLLAMLGDRTEELPQELRDEIDRAEAHAEEAPLQQIEAQAVDSLADLYADRPFELELRCDDCGRTYRYDVGQAMVDLESIDGFGMETVDEATRFPEQIRCKHCDAADPALTMSSYSLVAIGLRDLTTNDPSAGMMEGPVVPDLGEVADELEDTGDDTVDQTQHDEVGRNDPCPCGSGRKYKNCCLYD